MVQKRKIKCECGGTFEEKEIKFKGIMTPAEVCSKCNKVTFTKEQAEEFVRLKELQDAIEGSRKIIRIGNSMGITLPEKLSNFGLKIGSKVKVKATGPRSFEFVF